MQKQIMLTYNKFNDIKELSLDDQNLLKKAQEATKLSYAPYSNFKVGSAALLSNGEIIVGSNQENASYGVTICAERTLLSLISTTAPEAHIVTIAISYINENGHDDKPITPCGICRQALLEHQNRHNIKFRVIMSGRTGEILILDDSSMLLPLAFSSASLD